MSANLPLTRRIARAALLIAAGAAPVIGAAGSANAAALPQTTDLGAVTALDGASVGGTVDSGAQKATQAVGSTGGAAVAKGVPAAGKTVGKAVKTATPAVQKTAGETAGSAGTVLGETAKTATEGTAPAQQTAQGGLPLGQLPVKGLLTPGA
ncbi:ATP-binding protein [Streptomyces sp. NPDC056987]|uniref:ATP-binding protein n=1 Tax=Streptomyces sp. NPDC056987 TaxID=3345988 RepID=UPI00362EC4D2